VPLIQRLMRTDAGGATILMRLLVGGVFLAEGIQKYVYPEELGAGRFAHIGIPAPQVMGPFVGAVEIICGSLVVLGLLTRVAAIPLLITIAVAITSTKIPMLLGHSLGPFALPKLARYGIWSTIHEGRADLSMLFGLIFLLITGAGRLSLDARLARRPARLAGTGDAG
jgi:putative oxidoreductase